ncbi:cytochrome P450, partial [Aureobasidium melanogenum]
MTIKSFFLLGENPSSAQEIEVDFTHDIDTLKEDVGQYFGVAVPAGIAFQSGDTQLVDLADVEEAKSPIGISIDGREAKEPPGPRGIPIAGSYLEVYPDHLGNHQRMFESYGPVIKTTDMGRTTYYTNSPEIANICFAEGGYWAKMINKDHPLYQIKEPMAGVFLSDSNTEAWTIVHRFLAPALSPKAVRHYTPQMQKTAELSFKVFDELDEKEEAWNVYPYMFKMGSTAIGKLALGIDLHHFDSVDAPLHELVVKVGKNLELNKKVSTRGDWYSHLPFGEPKELRDTKSRLNQLMQEAIQKAKNEGAEDLPISEAALKADCIADYLARAVDQDGNKMPEKYQAPATLVAVGAGFVTTASLLSWLVYGLVQYPGNQERLLQELIDYGVHDKTTWTPDLANALPFLDMYIKETQRLHNPSYQPGRTALSDTILPGGYKIPKDSVMIVAIHHIHNNPAVWADPHKFNPDRWSSDAAKNRPKGSYVPFAAGPRMCIGFNFALQEVRVILSELIYRYEFTKASEEEVEYDPSFQLIRPMNLFVRAKRRTTWPSKKEDKSAEA